MSKKNKKQGKCIFCNGFGLSKQHVIPDWMSALLPYNDLHSQQTIDMSAVFDPASASVVVIPGETYKKRNGPVNQRKVRNVCLICNNGWISRVEDAAKPLFEAMICGRGAALSKTDVESLSLAIAIITIMWEFTHPDESNRVIPAAHRDFIYKNKRLPDGWYIAVGVMDELCVARPRQVSASFKEPSVAGQALIQRGYQVMTITLGYILIQAVTLVNFDYPIVFAKEKFLKIYPFVSEVNGWNENLQMQSIDKFVSISDSLSNDMYKSLLALIPR